MSLADRLRERRMKGSPATEADPENIPAPTISPNRRPSEDGDHPTSQAIVPTNAEVLAIVEVGTIDPSLSLAQRTGLFFKNLAAGIPLVGANPILAAGVRALTPHLIKELEALPPEGIEAVYKGMIVALAQIYAPGAEAIVINLRQQAGERAVEEIETELAELPALTTPPPPALPEPEASDEDDPLIGVEIEPAFYEGEVLVRAAVVIPMKQSQYRKLKEEANA